MIGYSDITPGRFFASVVKASSAVNYSALWFINDVLLECVTVVPLLKLPWKLWQRDIEEPGIISIYKASQNLSAEASLLHLKSLQTIVASSFAVFPEND